MNRFGKEILILSVVLTGAVAAAVWLFAQNRALQRRVMELEARIRIAETPRVQPAPPPQIPAAPPSEPSRKPTPEQRTAIIETVPPAVRQELEQARLRIDQLEAHIAELRSYGENVAADNKRLVAAQSDLRDDLAAKQRLVDALQAELKGKNDRLAQSETAAAKLRDQVGAQSRQTADTARLSAQLQDIQRQRDVYVANILRRYKDLTEQYRALSGELESRRDREAAGPSAGPELARIQNTLSLAEEDVRQLHSLDAQAQRLQKKLSGP